MRTLILVAFLIIYNVFGVSSQNSGPKVKISFGELQGTYLNSREGRKYSAFLGIPYAKPPKRFQLAEFPEKWQGIKNATSFGNICPQGQPFYSQEKGVAGSEDCLYLNVYSPNLQLFSDLPVMVFIHGGAFVSGSSDIYGADYLMDEDVVLVTINYRLGPLGFLNTGDGEVEGNLGLKDQVLALTWVQKNIHRFGGHSEKVTIFGESAGASCVHHHVISPLSKGLFSKAIAQSGTAVAPWAYSKNPEISAFALGNTLGCNTQKSKELLECLGKADLADIVNATSRFGEWINTPFPPSLEKRGKSQQIFLSDSPTNILKSGKYNKVPVVFTINEDEGLGLKSGPISVSPTSLREFSEDFLRIFPITFDYGNEGYTTAELNDISTKIKKFYFGDKEIGKETFQNLTNVYSDRHFIDPAEIAVTLYANDTTVYNGMFSYKGLYSVARYFGVNKMVVTHGDELQYFFTLPTALAPPFAPGSKFENASKFLVSLWVNFARTGNPGFKWTRLEWKPASGPAIEKTGMEWWDIDFPPQKLDNPFKERMQFWRNTLSKTY